MQLLGDPKAEVLNLFCAMNESESLVNAMDPF